MASFRTADLGTLKSQHGPSWRSRLGARGRDLIAVGALAVSGAALGWTQQSVAADPVIAISADPFLDPNSQHRTEVEPDTFANERTVVGAFQVGRFFDGGADSIGWATSTRSGTRWIHGFLPGLTKARGGAFDRVSDPSVAFDAAHGVWLISSLALTEEPIRGAAILVSRSRNGLRWDRPVTVAAASDGADFDKNWTVCDNTPTSPFYGSCYTEFDDFGHFNRIQMSTSRDGGLTWGAPRNTANNDIGLGGQPVVQPDGTVVVPIADAFESTILAFRSTDGGDTWSGAVVISPVAIHGVAGRLRTGALPSAEIDGAGRVYVAWQDCRFRAGCTSNDIVLSTSTDGVTWSPVTRVPIDPVDSGADHFIPGLAIDRATSGDGAHLALTYYYYPRAACTRRTCELNVGFISSLNGGETWTTPTRLAGPMSLTWLPDTLLGVMVGDYISTSFVGGVARPLFAVANAPIDTLLNETIDTVSFLPDEAAQPLPGPRDRLAHDFVPPPPSLPRARR